MKPTQILVLGLAVAAGGGAYYVATNMAPETVVAGKAEKVVVKAPTESVLVADKAVPLGQRLGEERMRWQEWPKSGIREGMVLKSADPEAIKGHAKLIARSTFYPGEPIRAEKLVRADRGYLSAILPRGYRAVALNVRAVTSAGGFVLPNDRVDVMMTTSEAQGDGGNVVTAEVLLQNIRVLAVDQLVQLQKDGSKSVIGDTATLQLTPDQAALLTETRAQVGDGALSLVLRSIADSGAAATDIVEARTRASKRMIRAGQISKLNLK